MALPRDYWQSSILLTSIPAVHSPKWSTASRPPVVHQRRCRTSPHAGPSSVYTTALVASCVSNWTRLCEGIFPLTMSFLECVRVCEFTLFPFGRLNNGQQQQQQQKSPHMLQRRQLKISRQKLVRIFKGLIFSFTPPVGAVVFYQVTTTKWLSARRQ